jgi:hypothetical protein
MVPERGMPPKTMLYQDCLSGLPRIGKIVEDVVSSLTGGVVNECQTGCVAI